MAKYKRKQFFINRELQGKYMLSFAIPMLSLLAFFAILFYFSLVRGLESSLELLNRDITEQVTFSLEGKQSPSATEYKAAIDGIKNTVSGFAQDEGKRQAVVRLLVWIIIPGFFLLMAQVLLLTVFFSHKLAGPVYRLELAMNRVLEGDFTEQVKLREGDQLTNLAELVNEVIAYSGKTIRDVAEVTDSSEKEKILEKVKLPLAS